MKKINIKKTYYLLRHQYLTLNNMVIVVALLVGAGWAWGSVEVMRRNFDLQKEVDDKRRQLMLVNLQAETLAYEQNYYKSGEYQELAIRDRLGKVMPGEKVLILPANSSAAKKADELVVDEDPSQLAATPPTNFELWVSFLFGSQNRDS